MQRESVYTYSIAVPADLPALKELGIKAFSVHEEQFTPEGWTEFCEGLVNETTVASLFAKSTVFICKHKSLIVGAAYFISSGHPEGMFESDWSYIRRVSVDPDHMGKGIAKELTR